MRRTHATSSCANAAATHVAAEAAPKGTECDRAVTRSCKTDRLSETAVLLVAFVTRLDARTVRRRREGRPNLVLDADTARFTLDPGDLEQVPDRQPGLPFDDLEVERDQHDPL
jgi:hypothetical protein